MNKTEEGHMQLRRALLLAALIEVPLFTSLVTVVFGYQKGPHSWGAMVLYFSQFPAVIIMGLFRSLDTTRPIGIALTWGGIFVLQYSLLTFIFYWMLEAIRKTDRHSPSR